MNPIPLAILLLSLNCMGSSPISQNSSLSRTKSAEMVQAAINQVSRCGVYLGAGVALDGASALARLGWGVYSFSPWAATTGKECRLLSKLCSGASKRAFAQMFTRQKGDGTSSWRLNYQLLSQIPTTSSEDKQLLLFLQERWLAKLSGFFSLPIDWVYPCFNVQLQVHPATNHSYARTPCTRVSQAYQKRMESWQRALADFSPLPLILTRPGELTAYLPACIDLLPKAKLDTVIDQLAVQLKNEGTRVLLNATALLSNDPKHWNSDWMKVKQAMLQACLDKQIDFRRIVCIQHIEQETIGGIRILPPIDEAANEIALQHQFLLDWISYSGLSVNRVELDRLSDITGPSFDKRSIRLKKNQPFEQQLLVYLDSLEQLPPSTAPHKELMIQGTLRILKGLLSELPPGKWEETLQCPTKGAVVQLSLEKIKQQLQQLSQEGAEVPFFQTAAQLEQIHAALSSLLEIFSFFSYADFPAIYRELLTAIPTHLKPLTSYGIHSSGMTSLAGIFKAVEKTVGKSPIVLYGENTYFEGIYAAKQLSALPFAEATDADWQKVDLLLTQFIPVLSLDPQVTTYKVEKVAEVVQRALAAKQGRPLFVAVDCTLDAINSPQVELFLQQFQQEIATGLLNVICYRSGNKFDLLGMDKYSGAPFFMIHNQESKWAPCSALLTDRVLQTDRLSLNWFCLAYRYAGAQLEQYRQQIFANTRQLLNKIPAQLLKQTGGRYRVTSFEPAAEPAFIDLKIFGPLHAMRAGALVGGSLFLHCMEGGHPIFNRPSLGFYHPNFTILFGQDCSTVRLTIGLDPGQVDLFADCFRTIHALNGVD